MRIASLVAAALLALALPAHAQQPRPRAQLNPGPLPLNLNLGNGVNSRTGAAGTDLFGAVQDGVNALSALRGAAGGIATLDGNGRLPVSQLPPVSLTLPNGGSITSLAITGDGSTGQIPGMSVAVPGFAPRTLAQLTTDTLLATSFSAANAPVDKYAVFDSTAGLQAAINYAQTDPRGLNALILPCGHYKVSATLKITGSNTKVIGDHPGCVRIERSGDYGPTFQIGNDYVQLADVGISNLILFDVPATNGTAGFSTCANSPYQVVADGINLLRMEHITIVNGCGGIALRAVYDAHILRPDIQINPIPGHPELNGQGTGFYVGFSNNSNLALRYSSAVWIADAEIEGGSLTTVNGSPVPNCKLADGFRLDGQDGTFATNSHVQCTTQADYHFAHNGAYPMYNINFTDVYADISNGHGILMDGTVPVTGRNVITGRASSAAVGGAGAHGFYNPGVGGGLNLLLDLEVDGYKGSGIRFEGPNWQNVVIRPRQITNCNLSNTGQAGIYVATATGLNITGGIVGGDGTLSEGIHLGSGVTNVTISGVNATNNKAYGVAAVPGVSGLVVTGNNLTSNGSGNSIDASITSKAISGNLGL